MSKNKNNKKRKQIPKPNIPPHHKIVPTLSRQAIQKNKKWVFSFTYFKQIKFFGLDKCEPKWFVSLIERLKDFSSYDIDEFKTNYTIKNNLRYHAINWDSPNTPIKREDLTWIPTDYLNNEIEFPMFQFMISKAMGRIVGFWNESSDVFNIVLLDPLHNIQPSKYFEYKVDDSYPLSCKYSSLLKDIDTIKSKYTKCSKCSIYDDLILLPKNSNTFSFIGCFLDDNTKLELLRKLETKSINDIIELGLMVEDGQIS